MAFSYNHIFQLPERNLLDKKLTKAFFLKNFELKAAEKKVLKNSITAMEWLGNIKPTNSNISAVVNAQYNYEEIQVMLCHLEEHQPEKIWATCREIFQKYIPYPILLIVEDELDFILNVVDKRINQADRSKRTIEKHITTPKINKLYKNEQIDAFFSALAFENLDKTNLETTYKSYSNALVQHQVAAQTGDYQARRQKRSEEDMEALEMIAFYEKEIEELKVFLKQEDQFSQKLEFNQQIKIRRDEIKTLKENLSAVWA